MFFKKTVAGCLVSLQNIVDDLETVLLETDVVFQKNEDTIMDLTHTNAELQVEMDKALKVKGKIQDLIS